MNELKDVLRAEIEEFRQVGADFKDGKLSVMDFKGKSGGFGVYAHRGGKEFMVRLRIPSGVTNAKELKLVYDFANKYNLEGIHFTTRQAIQLHGMDIDEICDLMRDALDVNIFTRGAGGNFPRNVALSPLSGVDKKESFDPTPYALAVGNHFLRKIYTYHLPRKLKVSFSNSSEDTAHCTVQDLGFLAVEKDGKDYFKVYIGGGLGNNPRKAIELDELIEPKDVIYHVEAMTNLFINEGDYKNKAKARIRYIAERMGDDAFAKLYKEYVEEEKKKGNLDVSTENSSISKQGKTTSIKDNRLYTQKQLGLYSVYVHPVGGQLKLEDLKTIIDIVENYEDVDIRLSMDEGIYIRNLNGDEAERVLAITKDMGACTELQKSVSCIGVPTCQIGIGNSQQLLRDIISYFESKKYEIDVLPKVFISGCPNSCGVHEIAKIGFTGKKKRVDDKVQDVFTLFIGGELGENKTKLGCSKGEILSSRIPEFLYNLAKEIENYKLTFDEYINQKEDHLNKFIEGYLV